jgi:hypothetical protein
MTKVLSVAALALLGSPALAERIEVQCETSAPYQLPGSVLCETRGSYSFRSDGPEVPFYLTVTAPASHCSDVSYIVYPAGTLLTVGISGRLRPGETQNIEIGAGFGPGEARLDIGAIGFVGDCNLGQMHSWAVEVSAAPVP